MVRGVLVCLALVSITSAQNAQNNTRIFGALGNIASAALGAVSGGFRPQQGHRPQHGHRPQQSFNPGGGFGQVGGGFGQVGGGFGQVGGGFGQGGGGFGQVGGGFGQGGGGFGQGGGGFGQGGGGFGQGGGGFGQVGGGIGQVSPVSQGATCRRWCKTPQGQAYCCEGGNEPIQAAVTKQGQCPPVRPSCPPTRGFAPPRQCSSDGGCGGFDKCCFDTCLQHHTCKPPIGFGK